MKSSSINKISIMKKMDKILLITSIILFVLGLVMIFSSSNVASYMKFNRAPYAFFMRQLIFVSVSFLMAFFTNMFTSACKIGSRDK